MANISDKTNLSQHGDILPTTNWISQINAGGQTYDIATHHNIIFKDGSGDTTGVKWNGLTDLEVVIPSITDIVQSPIVFVGTVSADGDGNGVISYNTSYVGTTKNKEGYLVFITADCKFAGAVCEAGDMAIYDGSEWKVVTGENQVSIVGNNGDAKTTVMVGSAKDVLTVEGKTLALVLDYAELDTHVSTTTGGTVDVVYGVGEAAPAAYSQYIKLDYEAGSAREIATKVSFENATALKDGKVNFTEGKDTFVTGVSFGDFKAGVFPTYKSNNGDIDLNVTGGSLNVVDGEEFVTSVSLAAVSISSANVGDANSFTAVTEVSNIAGTQSFLTDIHLTDTENNEKPNLTIGGYLAPSAGVSATFVTGLDDKTTTVITGITAGKFELVKGGTDIVTGLDTTATTVVTGVSYGTTDQDVLSSATVENNVLVLGAAKAVKSVTVTPTTAGFTKAGVSYTETRFTSASLVSDGFTKTSDVKYTFGSAKETISDYVTDSWKVVTPEISVSKGKYNLSNTGMKATIEANTFLTGVDKEGTLPSLTNTSFSTGKVEGSVATALSASTVNINALTEGVTSIATPGTYSLTTVDTAEPGAVEVGKAGVLKNMKATVNLSAYLTDVTIVTDASAPKAE